MAAQVKSLWEDSSEIASLSSTSSRREYGNVQRDASVVEAELTQRNAIFRVRFFGSALRNWCGCEWRCRQPTYHSLPPPPPSLTITTLAHQTVILLLDIVVDIVGVQALPTVLADAVDAAAIKRAHDVASRASSSLSTVASPPNSAGSDGSDPLAFVESAATQCYIRSLLMSLWLLQVRDSASTWFSAAAAAVTAPLASHLPSASPSLAGPSSSVADAVGSPNASITSPGGAASTGSGVTATTSPDAAAGGGLRSSPVAAAASRVRAMCGAELSRAAARVALLAHTSHAVRLWFRLQASSRVCVFVGRLRA